MKTYRLFLSHSWAYSDAYDRLTAMISRQINYYDHSVPKGNPIHTNGSDQELYDAIEAKIKGTSCVVIMAGVYASYSKWINKEIEIAKKYNKPIIAIEPWASTKTSALVKESATVIVRWNTSSVIGAIKEYG